MKKLFVFLCAVVLVISCGSTPKFSDAVEGKEWKLIEVRVNKKDINFDRDVLVKQGFGEIFTLKFDAENVSGKGAPNSYSAPFTLGEKQAISIKLMRSTLMASIYEPEKIREHDFFVYMQNVYEWQLVNDNLELHSKTPDDDEVVLIFSL